MSNGDIENTCISFRRFSPRPKRYCRQLFASERQRFLCQRKPTLASQTVCARCLRRVCQQWRTDAFAPSHTRTFTNKTNVPVLSHLSRYSFTVCLETRLVLRIERSHEKDEQSMEESSVCVRVVRSLASGVSNGVNVAETTDPTMRRASTMSEQGLDLSHAFSRALTQTTVSEAIQAIQAVPLRDDHFSREDSSLSSTLMYGHASSAFPCLP